MNDSTDTTQRDEMHALALGTAQRIEARAAAVLLLQEYAGVWWGDVPSDEREAVREARGVLELPDLVPNVDAATDVDDGLEEWADNEYSSGYLSIEARGSNSGSVVVVLGTGGPHVEVVWSFDRAQVVAFGWFGADRVELPVDADAVDALWGLSSFVEAFG